MATDWFSKKLLRWYDSHQRDLPWRKTTNAYLIWLSEVILQQTQVKQGLPYYNKFKERFETIQKLAAAKEEEVLRLWQGLGYYSRGRNLLSTAQHIVSTLDGMFPNSYEGLIKLKGIGPYTAAAIASFAFNEQVAVVDGNVFRVLSRVFGIYDDIQSVEGKKIFAALAQKLLPSKNTATYNQAIMEFGALQCVPKNPQCTVCIFKTSCIAFQKQEIDLLPVKTKKIKAKDRYFHYFIFNYKNTIGMRLRKDKDIWKGLYEFYLIEKKNTKPYLFLPTSIKKAKKLYEVKHVLSHQIIHACFWNITLETVLDKKKIVSEAGLTFYTLSEIKKLPKPILIAKCIETLII